MYQNPVQGFLIARTAALSFGANASDAGRIGVISLFFPNPLAGLVVARAMAKRQRPTKPKDPQSLALASLDDSGAQTGSSGGRTRGGGAAAASDQSSSPTQSGSSSPGTPASAKATPSTSA